MQEKQFKRKEEFKKKRHAVNSNGIDKTIWF